MLILCVVSRVMVWNIVNIVIIFVSFVYFCIKIVIDNYGICFVILIYLCE